MPGVLHLSRGPGVTIAGAGLALCTWTAERAGVKLPNWLLIPVGALAFAMVLGGLVVAFRDRRGGDSEESAPPPREPHLKPGYHARRARDLPPREGSGRVYGSAAVSDAIRRHQHQTELDSVEAALVAVIDEGVKLWGNVVSDKPSLLDFNGWRAPIVEFVGRVFGDTEKQRFVEVQPNGLGVRGRITGSLDWLRGLRDRPDSWRLRLEGDDLEAAIKALRGNSNAASTDVLPQLSFGRVHVPQTPQRIAFADDPQPHDFFTGRVLRVPVINAPGAETAKSVQALLTFKPEDTSGIWSPRDPAIAEWDTDPITTAVDIPGNGQPHLFDVAFVLDAEHVCVHQWTRHSREAALQGYGIAGKGVVKVEVRAAGQNGVAPEPLIDTLHIEALEGQLCAQWESEGLSTRTNCAPWRNPPRMPGGR